VYSISLIKIQNQSLEEIMSFATKPTCNWMQLVVACATTFEFEMISGHLCSYGAIGFSFILQNG
jgi:hypothetical protein